MKIIVIDNLFQPNVAGKIANGAQKYTRNQVALLSQVAEVYYITAAGSDIQFPNQFVLDGFFDLTIEAKADKVKHTKKIAEEIRKIILQVNPDVILDSCCKHLSALWNDYPPGSVVFEHYHRASAPLGADTRKKFESKKIYWVGVSKFQAKNFNNYFDDTISIHYDDNYPTEPLPSEPYGMFLARWDAGKAPHISLKNYVKSGLTIPIKCYIKYGGTDIPPKVLEELQKSPLLTFEIDAPRERILDVMSKASFTLASGNEGSSVVAFEFASRGVPYIVTKTGPVGEQEYLPDYAAYLAPTQEDLAAGVNKYMNWTFEDRKKLFDYIVNTFDDQHFIDEHMRVINDAQAKYPKGFLECLM